MSAKTTHEWIVSEFGFYCSACKTRVFTLGNAGICPGPLGDRDTPR